jgi:hypothetical protein
MSLSKTFSVLLVSFVPFTTQVIHAQGYLPHAQFSGQVAGDGTYDYTLTLDNDPSATASIGTFWFAWTDYGYDLLPSMPTITGLPTDWNASVLGGPYSIYGYTYLDGYSIEFTSTTPLAPGGSLQFQFNSPDAPNILDGNSPLFDIPIGTSFVYSGGPFSDAGGQLLVIPTPVPEPSPYRFLALSLGTLLFASRRRFGISPTRL